MIYSALTRWVKAELGLGLEISRMKNLLVKSRHEVAEKQTALDLLQRNIEIQKSKKKKKGGKKN